MLTTHEIKGSKAQIVEQIQGLSGRIVSALVLVDGPLSPEHRPLSDAEFLALMKEMESDTVSAPHADYSREAMYTRMPGE